jgi:hypothetical protein
LQLLDALRFALVRLAALLGARWNACSSAWVRCGVASTHAQPSARTSAAMPACRAPAFQQRGIGQIHARIAFREQVAADATACLP